MKGQQLPEIDFSKFSIPPADLKIVRRNGIFKVFDNLRKDYFVLTEEEFVRQAFVTWMIGYLGYPPSLMANEIGIKLHDTLKRCDTVVFNSMGEPIMIIEYKAPEVVIDQDVFNQIVRYNMVLKAEYLVVSNGYMIYCVKVDYNKNQIKFIDHMPFYNEIVKTNNV